MFFTRANPELTQTLYLKYSFVSSDTVHISLSSIPYYKSKTPKYYIPRTFTSFLKDKFGAEFVRTTTTIVAPGWIVTGWEPNDDIHYILDVFRERTNNRWSMRKHETTMNNVHKVVFDPLVQKDVSKKLFHP